MVDQLKKRFASCPNGDVTFGENIMTKSLETKNYIQDHCKKTYL